MVSAMTSASRLVIRCKDGVFILIVDGFAELGDLLEFGANQGHFFEASLG